MNLPSPSMARRNLHPKFLLGVLDEPISEKFYNEVSWNTSKIGGFPDWMQQGISIPCCRLCSQQLVLTVQIYCPLEGSPYHRTIYLFACVNQQCWNKSESWIALRCQKLDEAGDHQPLYLDIQRQRSSSDSWLENADDWEDNGNTEERPLNAQHTIESVNLQSHGCWGGTESLPVSIQHGSRLTQCDTDGNNVINMDDADDDEVDDDDDDDDDDGQNQNVILPEDVLYRHHHSDNIDALRNLDLSDSGNGVVEGAVGLDLGSEASAEVESPDEGTITIETPVIPAQDTIAYLFSERLNKLEGVQHIIKPWFLTVVEEFPPEIHLQLTDHERDLIMNYQKREGLNFNEIFNRTIINKSDLAGSGEPYEKSVPKHGDRSFYKLLARLRQCPSQLLRYSRDHNSFPIFIGPTNPDVLDPGKCPRCGKNRVFEMQLLPTLVDLMRIEGVEDPVVEFGTVVLYTCQGSCWNDSDLFCEEHVVLQADPDNTYFVAMATHKVS